VEEGEEEIFSNEDVELLPENKLNEIAQFLKTMKFRNTKHMSTTGVKMTCVCNYCRLPSFLPGTIKGSVERI